MMVVRQDCEGDGIEVQEAASQQSFLSPHERSCRRDLVP
jgi:hypothetical protein